MATPELHRRWVLRGGWKTPVPMGCSAHVPCTGMCTVASLSDSSFLVQRGCGCRGLLGCSMCSQGIHGPGSHRSTTPGVPQEPHTPCLFCSAGMEPPQAPRPPQPTHPLTAAAGPGRTLDYSSLPSSHPDAAGMGFPMPLSPTLWRGVQTLPRSSAAPTHCDTAEPMLGHLSGGKLPLPALQGSTGTPISFLMASCSSRPITWTDTPSPLESTSALAPAPPQPGAGSEEEPRTPPYLCVVNASC